MVGRSKIALVLTVVLLLGSVPAIAQVGAFDEAGGAYPYVQPDAEGDADVSWGDITELAAITLDDGTLLWRMTFADLSLASGPMRYCINFVVSGAAYQTGYRGDLAAGEPAGAATPCSWTDRGTSVGQPTFDAANNQIRIHVAASDIGSPSKGTAITDIQVTVGWAVVQGFPEFFDTLVPSVEPVSYAYGNQGVVPEPEDTPELPQTHWEELHEAVAAVSHQFDEPASDTYIFNWTATTDAVNLTYGAAVDGGSLHLSITDGEGIALVEQELDESFELQDLFEGTFPGTWTITVAYSDFVGSFFLTIEEHTEQEEASTSESTAPTTPTSAGPDGSENEGEQAPVHSEGGEEKKGLPGFGILALLAGLGVAAAVRRRDL